MHPWKTVEGLTIGDWDESSDDYYQQLVDRGDECAFCFSFSDDLECQCGTWDNDCWIGTARPWHVECLSGFQEARLSMKGSALQRESRLNHEDFLLDLAGRRVKRRARKRWMAIKDAVDARRIGLYWMEQTQRRLCAPGGAGRAADRDAFQAEF